MSRIRKNPLRPLTDQERQFLEQLVHARSERADVVTWARELLGVASGQTYAQAAAIAGRRSNEAASQLVARFNRDVLQTAGISAVKRSWLAIRLASLHTFPSRLRRAPTQTADSANKTSCICRIGTSTVAPPVTQ